MCGDGGSLPPSPSPDIMNQSSVKLSGGSVQFTHVIPTSVNDIHNYYDNVCFFRVPDHETRV
jgi:hypothetical protein